MSIKNVVRAVSMVSLVAITFVSGTGAAQQNRSVSLKVQGSVAAAPQWQNAGNANLTEIIFDFGSRIASQSAAVAVDSAEFQAKLVNAPTYPATVALVKPSACTIGTTSVANEHVEFHSNGSAVSGSSFSMTDSSLHAFRLRFSAAGSYGQASGTIGCGADGSLTYSY